MIVALDLPDRLAEAIAREAGWSGQTPASWIGDRLADRFGVPPRKQQRSPDALRRRARHLTELADKIENA